MITEFKGSCKGIRLIQRGKNDKHICFQILTEDDGTWHEEKNYTSSYWIDDLITQLQNAKKYLKKQTPDIYNGTQYGFKVK